MANDIGVEDVFARLAHFFANIFYSLRVCDPMILTWQDGEARIDPEGGNMLTRLTLEINMH